MLTFLASHWWATPALICALWAGSLALALVCGRAIAARDRQVPIDTDVDACMELALL